MATYNPSTVGEWIAHLRERVEAMETGGIPKVDLKKIEDQIIAAMVSAVKARIETMEKQVSASIAQIEQIKIQLRKVQSSYSFDAKRMRLNDKIDFSDWSSEEETIAGVDRYPNPDKYNNW